MNSIIAAEDEREHRASNSVGGVGWTTYQRERERWAGRPRDSRVSAGLDHVAVTGAGMEVGGEPHRKRDSAAFLVRIWREPGAPDGAEGVVRCYIKNLKTGEEQYMSSADALANQVLAQLAEARVSEGAPSLTGGRGCSRHADQDGAISQS